MNRALNLPTWKSTRLLVMPSSTGKQVSVHITVYLQCFVIMQACLHIKHIHIQACFLQQKGLDFSEKETEAVHMYNGFFLKQVCKYICPHGDAKTDLKVCQEYAKATCGTVTWTVKKRWPIKSQQTIMMPKKAHNFDVVKQNVNAEIGFLKIFTVAGVFKKLNFQKSKIAFMWKFKLHLN